MLFRSKKGGTEIEDYNTKDVLEKYGVTPDQIIDLKGLMGDTSDNIPGVPGIGEKTAAKIIGAFETIENAYAHIDEVMPNKARESLKANYDLALLSKELATIKIDCEIDYSMEDGKLGDMFNEQAFVLIKKLEFKSFLTRFQGDVGGNEKIEESFKLIDSLDQAETVFSEIYKEQDKAGKAKGQKGDRVQADSLDQQNSRTTSFQQPDTFIDNTRIRDFLNKYEAFHVSSAIIQDKGEILGMALSYGDNKTCLIKTEGLITEDYLLEKLN